MQAVTLVILALVAGTRSFMIRVPLAPISEPALAPSGWVHLQKLVLPLFENVCEESSNPAICRLSQEFAADPTAADFWNLDVITKFRNLQSGKGFLPKGEIFSDYNQTHSEELNIIFDVMYNAKNFDTFYKVAAWARQNLNCGLYVNLIYLAMENRRDTEKLSLPPPYELLPNYFIRKDIIIRGSSLLAGEEFTPSEGVRDEGNAYTLDANYTANFYDNDDESKLAYFREDIGLNSYYFLKMLKRAPWLNRKVDINSKYGEELYHMMKQLVARYNLERYSNGLPEQDSLSWDAMFDSPYDPMLVYSNGKEFIHRSASLQLPENADKALLGTIENNIATVVVHMRESGYNKTQILNHLMEILVTGEKSYDTLARQLLGKALSNNGQPTVFDHYMTSLRDPMIWKLFKKMVELIDNALSNLLPYAKSELYFPGVEVVSVEVKKMMTNFDYFEFDITEALKIGNGDNTFQVKIGQSRLTHKPFTLKVNVSSLVTQKGLVKIYVAPKMIPGEFAKKKNLFVLLDFFDINLKRGSNIITRASNDMKQFSSDFISLKDMYKRVEDAQFGLDSWPMNTIDSQIHFPERLSIPKGTPEGLPLQLFVIVAPYVKTTFNGPYATANELNSAILSPLYPLDLPLEDRILLDLPNAILKDITVTHKGSSKGSGYGGAESGNSWSSKSSYGPPTKPNTYNNGNDPYYGIQDDTYDMVQNDVPFLPLRDNFKPNYEYIGKSKKSVDNKPSVDSIRITDQVSDNTIQNDNEIDKYIEDESTVNKMYDKIYKDQTAYESPMPTKHKLLKSISPIVSINKQSNVDIKPKQQKYDASDYAGKKADSNVVVNKSFVRNIVSPIKTKEMKADLVTVNDKIAKQNTADVDTHDSVEVYKIYRNKSNLDSSKVFPSDKFDEIIVKEAPDLDNDFIGIYKDGNEEFVKVVPVVISDVLKENNNTLYKYIMRVIQNRDNGDKSKPVEESN